MQNWSKKLWSGVLLMEVSREAEVVSLQLSTIITSIPIMAISHRGANPCKGVIVLMIWQKRTQVSFWMNINIKMLLKCEQSWSRRTGQRRSNTTFQPLRNPQFLLLWKLGTTSFECNIGCFKDRMVPLEKGVRKQFPRVLDPLQPASLHRLCSKLFEEMLHRYHLVCWWYNKLSSR